MNDAFSKLVTDWRHDEPFYIVDLGDICRKVKLWRLKMPRVIPFYAVKCNPIPTVLKTIAHFGFGFDCASKEEIEAVFNETGVDALRIIYANPCKTRSFIKHARSRGVKRMTFDNEDELEKIAEIYPEAELVLRIKVNDSSSPMRLSAKFGAALDDVPKLLEVAADLDLNVVGVSFYVGSAYSDAECFSKAILNARRIFDQAELYDFQMTLLDLGGGFPGNSGSEPLFDNCARAINRQLDESFPEGCGVEVIAEPGHFMAASAFTLYTTVIAVRQEHDNRFMYYLNDGVYGSFNCKVFDHNDPQPIPVGKRNTGVSYPSVLWGPTCDSLDKVHENVLLPKLEIGDWLLFRDMGAYTCSTASNFNGFSKPSFHFVVNTATELILSGSIIGRQLLKELEASQGRLQELVLKVGQDVFLHGDINPSALHNQQKAPINTSDTYVTQ